jgi:hypothetical protein
VGFTVGALVGDALGSGVGAATVVTVSVWSAVVVVSAVLVVAVLRVMVVTPVVLVETAVTVVPEAMTVPVTVAPTSMVDATADEVTVVVLIEMGLVTTMVTVPSVV